MGFRITDTLLSACANYAAPEIGRIELDRTFEERDTINAQVVQAVDKASNPWGVKVLRYEIKDINFYYGSRCTREANASEGASRGSRRVRG